MRVLTGLPAAVAGLVAATATTTATDAAGWGICRLQWLVSPVCGKGQLRGSEMKAEQLCSLNCSPVEVTAA